MQMAVLRVDARRQTRVGGVMLATMASGIGLITQRLQDFALPTTTMETGDLKQRLKPNFLLLLLLGSLSACGSSHSSSNDATATLASTDADSAATHGSASATAGSKDAPENHNQRISDSAAGFSIAVPDDVTVTHDFQASTFEQGAWKAYASDKGSGKPVLALVLKGSNDVTTAALRIGVGSSPDAIEHCDDAPASGSTARAGAVTIAGETFQHFSAGNAGMSHYQNVESYRAVHTGRCYAIDLIVSGVNPKVFSPPRRAPFSRDQALQQLDAVLKTFRFEAG